MESEYLWDIWMDEGWKILLIGRGLVRASSKDLEE